MIEANSKSIQNVGSAVVIAGGSQTDHPISNKKSKGALVLIQGPSREFYEYRDALETLPQRGEGLHGALLGVCNRGLYAGLSPNAIKSDLEKLNRDFKPGEIEDAIDKALSTRDDAVTVAKYARTPGRVLQQKLQASPICTAVRDELIRKGGSSFDPLSPKMQKQIADAYPGTLGETIAFLTYAYKPSDLLFIGHTYVSPAHQAEHIKPVSEWIEFFQDLSAKLDRENETSKMQKLQGLGETYPLYCINPLLGEARPTKNGGMTMRGDNCVADFRYIIIEHDELPLDQQIPLLVGLELPTRSIVFSGSRSLHTLIPAVDMCGGKTISSADDWDKEIKANLFGQLEILGFDPATKNPSRLSRLPGMYRAEKQNYQRLIYINRGEN